MKEYFEGSIKRLNSEIAELEKKQIERNERLREIEENNKSGFHVPNPVKAIKQKEEAKRISKALSADETKLRELREELESCEEELMKIEKGLALKEHSRRQLIPILAGAAVLLIGFSVVGVMFLGNNKKEEVAVAVANNEPSQEEIFHEDPSQEEHSLEDPTRAITVEEEKSESVSDVSTVKETVVEQSAISYSTVESTQVVENTNTSDTEKSMELAENADEADTNDEEVIEEMLKLTYEDFSLQGERDYAHYFNDSIYLGNDEGVTISIIIGKSDVTAEDLTFYYDDSLLNLDISEPIHETGKTIIKVYVTANEECNTELLIGTVYDEMTKGENAMGLVFPIRKLDTEEGRIVYVTPSGEKYHYSSNCAGENAVATTYYDVTMMEMKPCGNCAE